MRGELVEVSHITPPSLSVTVKQDKQVPDIAAVMSIIREAAGESKPA